MASQAVSAARRVYSMPPAHGALLAGRVLSSSQLRSSWEAELGQICERINGLRGQFQEALTTATGRDFGFIGTEHGMFSFLGLTVEQVHRLRDEFAIYTVDSSRVNVASFNQDNMDYFIEALACVLDE